MSASILNSFSKTNVPPNAIINGTPELVDKFTAVNCSIVCNGGDCQLYIKYGDNPSEFIFNEVHEVLDMTPLSVSTFVKSKYLLVTVVNKTNSLISVNVYTALSNASPNNVDVKLNYEDDSVTVYNTVENPLNVTGTISVDTTGLATSALQEQQLANLAILADCVTDNKVAVSGTVSVDTSELATSVLQVQQLSNIVVLQNIESDILSNVVGLADYFAENLTFNPSKALWVAVNNLPTDYSNVVLQQNILSNLQVFNGQTQSNLAAITEAIDNLPVPFAPTGYISVSVDGYSGFTGVQTVQNDGSFMGATGYISVSVEGYSGFTGVQTVQNDGSFLGQTGHISVSNYGLLGVTGSVGLTGAVQIDSSSVSPVHITGSVDVGLETYAWSNRDPPLPASADALSSALFATVDNALVAITANVDTSALLVEITNPIITQQTSNIYFSNLANLDVPLSGVSNSINANIALSNSNLAILAGGVANNKFQCNASIADNQVIGISGLVNTSNIYFGQLSNLNAGLNTLSTQATSADILSNLASFSGKFSTTSGQTQIYTNSQISNSPFVYVAKRNGNDQILAADSQGALSVNVANGVNVSNIDVPLSGVSNSINANIALGNSNLAGINSNIGSVIDSGSFKVLVQNAAIPVSNVAFDNLANLNIPLSSIPTSINANIALSNSNLAIIAGAVDSANVNVHLYASHNSSRVPVQADNSGQLITHAMLQDGNGTDITSTTVSTKTGIDANIINNMVNVSNIALDFPLSGVNSNIATITGTVAAGSVKVNVQNSTLATTQSGTWNMRIQDSAGGSLNATTNALNVYNTNNITGFATSANQDTTNGYLRNLSNCVVSTSNLYILPRSTAPTYTNYSNSYVFSGAGVSSTLLDLSTQITSNQLKSCIVVGSTSGVASSLNYEYQVSNDNSNFWSLFSSTEGAMTSGQTKLRSYSFTGNPPFRYLRIYNSYAGAITYYVAVLFSQ